MNIEKSEHEDGWNTVTDAPVRGCDWRFRRTYGAFYVSYAGPDQDSDDCEINCEPADPSAQQRINDASIDAIAELALREINSELDSVSDYSREPGEGECDACGEWEEYRYWWRRARLCEGCVEDVSGESPHPFADKPSHPSYADVSKRYDLWEDYVDPDGLDTFEMWMDTPLEERILTQVECFGPELDRQE